MTGNADLVVLGAGPAGLAAAWRAARRGLSVDVLERAETVGGMAASFDVAGFRVDFGSHRLNPDLPEHILSDLRALMGSDLQTRYRNGRLLVGDRWVAYPFKPRELAKSMPAVPMARAAFDALATTWRGKKQTAAADSYAELMRAGFGPTMYKQVYEPYAAKLWGVSGEDIDIDQARRKAGSQTMWSALVRSVRNSIASESLAYLYPRRGFGQLCESLADAAMQAGARIRLGAAAEHLAVDGSGVSVKLARSEFHSAAAERGGWSGEQHWADSGTDIRAGHVFSTIPVPLLARLTSPGAPYEAVEASGKLRFRAILLVFAVHAGGRWSESDVHYIPDGDTPVTRISEPANHRFSPDDPTERTVLCFEIPCDIGDDLWAADEDQLANLIRETVRRLGLPRLNLEWVQVKRMRQVYPIYHKGYREALADLENWVETLPHVTTFGRLGLFTPDNTHHALMMGYEAADALGSGQWDQRMWAQARDRFSQHVVES